jgi:hypothetical protein
MAWFGTVNILMCPNSRSLHIGHIVVADASAGAVETSLVVSVVEDQQRSSRGAL